MNGELNHMKKFINRDEEKLMPEESYEQIYDTNLCRNEPDFLDFMEN